ncbi:MAG: Ig-like domain-containing protein [Synergistaceae bacterium]|nr:Ig-like domain-containing protein [Synergistaceae bacterium]
MPTQPSFSSKRVGSTPAHDNFSNNTFSNNQANSGGAVALASGKTTDFNSCTFTGNSASYSGGAVYVNSGDYVNFKNSQFLSNSSGIGGGALDNGGHVEIDEGKFDGNKANSYAGAIYQHGQTLSLLGTIQFLNNHATHHGGSMCTPNYDFGTATLVFENNTTDGTGGAIHGHGNLTFPATVTFRNNTAQVSGGAIYGSGSVKIDGGVFENNQAIASNSNNGGGAVFAVGNIDLTNVILTKNATTNGTGGATYSRGTSTLTNCVFEENLAGVSGGAAFAGDVKAVQTTFRSNNASGSNGGGGFGGALYLNPGNAQSTFDNCLFESNQSKADGGSVFVTGDQHVTLFATSVFDKNYSAGTQGGAVSHKGKKVQFSRCTFTGNFVKSSTNAQGGAVFANAATSQFANCTFVGNDAGSGKGGAIALSDPGGVTTQDSVIFYCTFTENTAGGGQGGAVYTEMSTVNFGASAFVGNTATHGDDVFRASGTIISLGYNILGNYGVTGSGGPAGNVDWAADPGVTGGNGQNGSDKHGPQYTRALLFGSNSLADNVSSGGTAIEVGSSLSTTQTLKTLETVPTTVSAVNPALDYIPGQIALNLFKSYFAGFPHTDERGVSRPVPTGGNSDVGAFERGDGTVPPIPPSTGVISYVRMSGIPNTMTKIGQTCSLTAVVYYQNGSSSTTEAVVWGSSSPGVASIDQFGNLVSLMQGKTTISVTTERLDANSQHASDSAELEVSEEWSYTNIHPDVWKKLGLFNSEIEQYAEQLHFVDADPSEVEEDEFAKGFKSVYGVSASQVSELRNASAVTFSSKSSYAANNWASAKPSIAISLSALSVGSLLPLEFTYSLSWSEVSKILGREVTKIGSATELFGSFKLLFESAGGTLSPVVDADGEFGISAAQAMSSGALSMNNGNNGLTLTLRVLLGDVQSASDGKPKLIDKRLVVADGAADGTAAGAMWLLQRTGKGGETVSGESGGGGCSAGSGLASLALAIAWIVKERRL